MQADRHSWWLPVWRIVSAYLEAREIDPQPIAREFSPRLGAGSHDARLPVDDEIVLYREAVSLTGDPNFGLHAGARLTRGGTGPIDLALRCCDDGVDVMQTLTRYGPLVDTYTEIGFDDAEGQVSFRMRAPDDLAQPLFHAYECTLAGLWRVLAEVTGARTPRVIAFQHERPGAIDPYVRVFGTAPRFGADANVLALERELAERPNHTRDPAVREYIEAYLGELASRVATPQGVRARTREAVVVSMRGASPTVQDVAQQLALSPRTLQRRLAEEGTTFGAVVDDVRRELARSHLAQNELCLAEVAFLLGFASQSAFTRAFKRWTGSTPGEYRRETA